MTIDIPKFGSPSDLDESSLHLPGFFIEMFRCTNSNGGSSKYVNILHVSTDLKCALSEIDRIVQFMKEKGFDVSHEQSLNMENGMNVDIVIVGSEAARFEDAYYIIRRMSLGFLGIVPYWDVLWYGIDDIPPYLPMATQLLRSNHMFSMDGICLIHAHIRRRDDVTGWNSLYLAMAVTIENYIDKMMDTWNVRNAYEKISKFEVKVKSDGRGGPDAELFFAAADVIRSTRNLGAHALVNMPAEKLKEKVEKMNKLIAKFDELAERYGCPFRPPKFISPIPVEYTHMQLKWLTSLTQISVAWIAEYAEL